MTTQATTLRTLYDKIWDQHVVHIQEDGRALLYIDRHIIHEATSAQAFEGLRETGRTVRRPDLTLATTDHIVPTTSRKQFSSTDDYLPEFKARELCKALENNAKEYGFKFFGINDKRQGIVHIIAPEQGFILPGTTCVCGDSHTSTHGAFGALAFGIGTSEVEHVLATQTLLQKKSKNMRVSVNGDLPEGVSSKDVILHIIGKIGIAGGTGCVIEYAGSVFSNFSIEERMSICNMSIEAGARAGLIAPDQKTLEYLKGRTFAPELGLSWDQAEQYWLSLHTDNGAHFDREISIDGEEIAPCVTWGTSPQDVVSITERVPHPASFPDAHRRQSAIRSLEYMGLNPGMPMQDIAVDKVFIGSCTNGRIEDLRSVASVIEAAGPGAHVAEGVYAMIVPGSGIVRDQAEAEGLHILFQRAGFDWREAGCSMCCGLNQDRLKPQERCASTSNRNFEGRQGSGGRSHLLSPAMAAAAALNGKLTDVRKYSVTVRKANSPKSTIEVEIPTDGGTGASLQESPPRPQRKISQSIIPDRLSEKHFQILRGIAAPMEMENIDTDVIIAVPFLTGTKRTGFGKYAFHTLRFDPKTGEKTDFVLNREPYNQSCIIVCTGSNFGCGSSREAAPWSLKEFGIRCIIAPSFAEIFENNCFKNGLLPITLPRDICEDLHKDASQGLSLEVDLKELEIRRELGNPAVKFQVDAFRRTCLLEGLDEIGLSLQKAAYIDEFERIKAKERGWMDQGLSDGTPSSEMKLTEKGNLNWLAREMWGLIARQELNLIASDTKSYKYRV